MSIVTERVTGQHNQASVAFAADELASLPLYAASAQQDSAAILARALELCKAWLPAEVKYSIDAILDAQAMAASEWCMSAKEKAG